VTLQELLPANLFAVMLVFARTGTALSLLPGFGELTVPQRYRLLFALFLSLILAAVLAPLLPPLPASPVQLCVLLFGEVVVGFFLGTVARILLTALEIAGGIISLQLGLSAAMVFNPTAQQQSPLTGSLLMVLGVVLLFATDTHHLMLRGIVDSYALFAPGVVPPLSDLSDAMARIVATSFLLAVQISAPFIVIGTIFFAALGLVSRLMPQLQLFFIVMPVQIIGGFLVLAFTLAAMMRWFVDAFAQGFTGLLSP
jgi:flagellar biosynthetic protein FliR